jgi:cation diffusion facilitator CzcD-associated flavoprotein CzcO
LILEAREGLGGTWDLFRYPGIRSDSDMHTMGFSFRPWRSAKSISDGGAILQYLRDTAHEHGIESAIRFGERVVRASWDSNAACWSVEVQAGAEARSRRYVCQFLYMCTGYYDYAAGYRPQWQGMESFAGPIVHPQHWPQDLDYAGKRVVVIGSGATAVTLVPSMATRAAHVTMLQRSPTYVLSVPERDAIAGWMHHLLPEKLAHSLVRWKNVLLTMALFSLSRRFPRVCKSVLTKLARQDLGPDYDMVHFEPRYNPWDQRMCLVPDGDLFNTLRQGAASIVTDTIAAFTPGGIRLESGRELPADIIVTATGLRVKMMGGIRFDIDGTPVNVADKIIYRGLMCSDMPNFAFAFGYTNASWTLKAELSAEYVCRLLNYMDAQGCVAGTPRAPVNMETVQGIDLSSGYVQRAAAEFPKQGIDKPWLLNQNYLRDIAALRYGPVDDGVLEFKRAAALQVA